MNLVVNHCHVRKKFISAENLSGSSQPQKPRTSAVKNSYSNSELKTLLNLFTVVLPLFYRLQIVILFYYFLRETKIGRYIIANEAA
jgi:ribose/xylose/arabinose/galactoside ABC-type transport system permease subunit